MFDSEPYLPPAGELKVQEFLRQGGTPQQLTQRYAIKVKPHRDHPELLGFYYNQIHSPMSLRLVQECRGLILNSADNWRVVSCPFFKFFNHGEPDAAKMNWDSAYFQHKLDGSLMSLFYYKGWKVASNGTPDASGEVNGKPGTRFSELFWETWNALGYVLPVPGSVQTYMFELTTPFNRVVVRHDESMLTLIGVRNNVTLLEEHIKRRIGRCNWRIVMSHEGKLDDALAFIAKMEGHKDEGMVAVDQKFNRVKIKCPDYLRLHRLVDHNVSEKRMLDIILQGEAQEVLTYFPEHKPMHERVTAKVDAFIDTVNKQYSSVKYIEDRKAYALAVTAMKPRCPDLLFKLHQNRANNLKLYLMGLTLDKAAEMVL